IRPPTSDTYPLSLHDALPICLARLSAALSAANSLISLGLGSLPVRSRQTRRMNCSSVVFAAGLTPIFFSSSSTRRSISPASSRRSEEHTSELQSLAYLVCRLL